MEEYLQKTVYNSYESLLIEAFGVDGLITSNIGYNYRDQDNGLVIRAVFTPVYSTSDNSFLFIGGVSCGYGFLTYNYYNLNSKV